MSKFFELVSRSGTEVLVPPPANPRILVKEMPRPYQGRQELEPNAWEALRVLRKHWRLSLAFACAVIACTAIYVFTAKPVYEASTKLEVDAGNQLFSLELANARSDPSTQFSETQAKMLQSDELALAIIRELHLTAGRSWRDGIVTATTAAPAAGGNLQPISREEYATLREFRKSLHVTRDNSSWLINVSFEAHDPYLASNVANTLVDSFIERSYKARTEAITASTQWLTHQLDDIRQRMNESNQALMDFQKSSGIASAGESRSSVDERMSELTRQLTLAQAERIQMDALLARVAPGNAPNLSQVTADPNVQDLSRKLDAARDELTQALVIYGENHPKIQQLKLQINDLERQLSAQQSRIVDTLRTSFSAAHRREMLLNGEIASTSKQLGLVAEYGALKKQAQANEELYNNLFAKVKEAAISAEAKASNIRLVERAAVPDRPARPRKLLSLATALAIGLFGGVFLAFAYETLDPKVRTLEDLTQCTGLPMVAVMPRFDESRTKLITDGNPQPFLLERPSSPEAEAVRTLFTSVMLAGQPTQALLIASGAPGEGKTTIATNLAIALARHRRTCIVEADVRRPAIAKVLGLRPECGLVQLLAGGCTLEEVLVPVPGIPNLTLLPSGPPMVDGCDFATNEQMAIVLRQLRARFASIIIDSAPVLAFSDARALSAFVDGVILVGRSGMTTREALKRTVDVLQQAQAAPILEVVLNAVPYNATEYGQYGYGNN